MIMLTIPVIIEASIQRVLDEVVDVGTSNARQHHARILLCKSPE